MLTTVKLIHISILIIDSYHLCVCEEHFRFILLAYFKYTKK